MNLKNYGFIVLAPQYEPGLQHAALENQCFRTEIVGVCSIEAAIDAARSLIAQGVQLIELCGGFGDDNAQQVISALNTEVPIGYVNFSRAEQEKLALLMDSGSS